MNNLSPQGSSTPRRQPARTEIRTRDVVAVIVTLALIVGPIFGFAFYMANRQSEEQSAERAAFKPAIGNFVFVPNETGRGASRPKVGKVVLVDADKRVLDELQPYLADDIHAKTPDQVTTVAQMRYTRKIVGKFESGAHAIEVSAKMTVIDVPSRTIIAARSFDWGKPPTRVPIGSREDVAGTAPMKEINAYLTWLAKGT
jgi:hypothetical protein